MGSVSANSPRNYQAAWTRCRQWLNNRSVTTDDLSDELMAVYIASLDAEEKTPATIAVAVAAVNCGDFKDNTLTIRQSKTDQLSEGRVLFVGDETWQVFGIDIFGVRNLKCSLKAVVARVREGLRSQTLLPKTLENG